MYQPRHFREDRLEVQHALIRAYPLGLLVTAGPSGLIANPVPFVLDPEVGTLGTLRAHLARANPQGGELREIDTCLVVFQGPQSYITPSWYAAKAETGKVVPTWNYAMVQVRGRPQVIEDLGWLRRQIDDLTRLQEDTRPAPWQVDDAPEAYVAGLIKGIVGLEIPITQIEGKWKVSQNRPEADRAGVIAGLRDRGSLGDTMADAMADMMSKHGTPR